MDNLVWEAEQDESVIFNETIMIILLIIYFFEREKGNIVLGVIVTLSAVSIILWLVASCMNHTWKIRPNMFQDTKEVIKKRRKEREIGRIEGGQRDK